MKQTLKYTSGTLACIALLGGTGCNSDNLQFNSTEPAVSPTPSSSSTPTPTPTPSSTTGLLPCGTTLVTWSAPTSNTNGTPLTDLAGYNIVYGYNATSYYGLINIPNPNATSYDLTALGSPTATMTYYFWLQSYDSSGVDSAFTGPVAIIYPPCDPTAQVSPTPATSPMPGPAASPDPSPSAVPSPAID